MKKILAIVGTVLLLLGIVFGTLVVLEVFDDSPQVGTYCTIILACLVIGTILVVLGKPKPR